MEFRPDAREGLWLCFLLPISMMLTNINNVSTHQSSNLTANFLAFILSLHSVYFALFTPLPSLSDLKIRKKLINYFKHYFPLIMTFTVMLLIITLIILGLFEFSMCLVGFMVFKTLLPKLFSTFKKSFSYGEGCLVLQSLVVFCAKSFLSGVVYDDHDPSTVEGSFNIIANVGLVSLLVLCAISYIPMFSFINNSTTFYLTE